MERDGLAGAAREVTDALTNRWTALRSELLRRQRRILEFQVRPHLLNGRVTHVSGPPTVEYGQDELLVSCVVRNGASYVRPFIEHYTRLGAKHMVFLDNGSTDGTLEMLSAAPATTVLQTRASYSRYENTMKLYLAKRYSRGRWNLCVDIDELFDYPFSATMDVGRFLRYLNTHGYTAVVAQMLDLFPDAPLTALTGESDGALAATHRFYDLADIEKSDYDWSESRNSAIRMHWGGIRRAMFGTNNGLTKAALVMMDGRVQPFQQWHHVVGARLADVSCVLRHYPFTSTFPAKVRDAVQTRRYGETTSDEYVGYMTALERSPGLELKRATAREFRGVDALVDEGFLVVSDEYRRWAAGGDHGDRR